MDTERIEAFRAWLYNESMILKWKKDYYNQLHNVEIYKVFRYRSYELEIVLNKFNEIVCGE